MSLAAIAAAHFDFREVSLLDGGVVRAIKSGASRSSSPAIPTSVNNA